MFQSHACFLLESLTKLLVCFVVSSVVVPRTPSNWSYDVSSQLYGMKKKLAQALPWPKICGRTRASVAEALTRCKLCNGSTLAEAKPCSHLTDSKVILSQDCCGRVSQCASSVDLRMEENAELALGLAHSMDKWQPLDAGIVKPSRTGCGSTGSGPKKAQGLRCPQALRHDAVARESTDERPPTPLRRSSQPLLGGDGLYRRGRNLRRCNEGAPLSIINK